MSGVAGGEPPAERPAFKPREGGPGIGQPAADLLDIFGTWIHHAFGQHCYLVGSSLHGKTWRDVDVRLILDDAAYEHLMGTSRPGDAALRPLLHAALSLLAERMTGLPVDFQIQSMTEANVPENGTRSALGIWHTDMVPPFGHDPFSKFEGASDA